MSDGELLSWGKSSESRPSETWPKDENGEAVVPALLCTVSNTNFKDDLVIGMLESCGIPCFKRYPGNGSFGRLILGVSGQGVEIYVPETILEDAQTLLNEENGNEL